MRAYDTTYKIRNENVKRIMREADIHNVAQLSRLSGVPQTELGLLVNGRLTPRDRRGRWRRPVHRLSKALCRAPSELFPEHEEHEELMPRVPDTAQEPSVYAELGEDELSEVVAKVLETVLTPKEYEAVRGHYWDRLTLREIGGKQPKRRPRVWGTSPERIRQRLAKALRKLRHNRYRWLGDELLALG